MIRYVWSRGLHLWQKPKAAHPRHIDVGQDQNERAVACLGDALRRSSSTMAEHAQRFAENNIDFAKLSGLTDQDLETIGVECPPRWGTMTAVGF